MTDTRGHLKNYFLRERARGKERVSVLIAIVDQLRRRTCFTPIFFSSVFPSSYRR